MSFADIFDEHRRYWADTVRVEAYTQALRQVIKPGMSVVDLGCGTGLLGLLACKAGATKVYGIEATPLIDTASALFKANGFGERFVPMQGWSNQIELPERCDAVIADQLGPLGLEAGILEAFEDAKRRLLKPGGVLVPQQLSLYFAPVEVPNEYTAFERWKTPLHGLKSDAVFEKAVNHFGPVQVEDTELRGTPVKAATIDLRTSTPESIALKGTWSFGKPATIHGIVAWFEAELAPGISITNSPLAEHPLNRDQAFFPFEQMLELPAHSELSFELQAIPAAQLYSWTTTVAISCPTEKRFMQSTFKGLLTSEVWLKRTMPHTKPSLSTHGAAVQTILSLCDGNRSVSEIEKLTYEKHRQQFSTPEQAAVAVAEVLRTHGR